MPHPSGFLIDTDTDRKWNSDERVPAISGAGEC